MCIRDSNNGVRFDKTDELEENMVKNKVKENTVNLVPNCQKKDDGIKLKLPYYHRYGL